MNKQLIVISSLFVILVLIVLVLYLFPITGILQPHVSALPSKMFGLPLQVPSNDYTDSNNLTSEEKMDAITLALNNPTITGAIQHTSSILNNTTITGAPPNVNVSITIVISNVTSVSAGELTGIDSGFLNTSSKIAYLYISFIGGSYASLANNYVVYMDLSNNRTLGLVTFEGIGSPVATVTIPPASIWYTQVSGPPRLSADNEPEMRPYFSVNEADVNTSSMMILSNDNFDKFKEGLPYTALKYVDYMTNTTMVADGSQLLHINSYNGTDQCAAFVSFNNSIPADVKPGFPNLYYYVLIVNKNTDNDINITYSN